MEYIGRQRLDVKDQDSIFLFGNDVQTKINGYTKAISDIILYGQSEAEYILMDMRQGMDSFNKILTGPCGIWRSFNISKNYIKILSNINTLELALKLQEAKLLKDIEVFKRINPLMKETEQELLSLIQYGQEVLNKSMRTSDDAEQQIWTVRLEKRLSDMEVSQTVLAQTKKQIELLATNDRYLIDKILAVLGTTIPIWRTQVSLLLGLERANEQTLLQNKIAIATETYAKENAAILKKEVRKIKKKKEIDIGGIKKLNDFFLVEMNNLSASENENNKIVADTKRILLKA